MPKPVGAARSYKRQSELPANSSGLWCGCRPGCWVIDKQWVLVGLVGWWGWGTPCPILSSPTPEPALLTADNWPATTVQAPSLNQWCCTPSVDLTSSSCLPQYPLRIRSDSAPPPNSPPAYTESFTLAPSFLKVLYVSVVFRLFRPSCQHFWSPGGGGRFSAAAPGLRVRKASRHVQGEERKQDLLDQGR
jgi:hypothetical protein